MFSLIFVFVWGALVWHFGNKFLDWLGRAIEPVRPGIYDFDVNGKKFFVREVEAKDFP